MSDKTSEQHALRGWITRLVGWVCGLLTRPSEWVTRPRLPEPTGGEGYGKIAHRVRKVDNWVAFCFVTEIVAFVLVTTLRTTCPLLCYGIITLVGLRILEIAAKAFRVGVFDQLDAPPQKKYVVASVDRVVVLGLVNYLELIVTFATIYAFNRDSIVGATDWFAPIYLSAISQLTIGYGDIHPGYWLRPVAVIQGLMALSILVVLVARFVAALPPMPSAFDKANADDKEPHG